MKVEIKASSFMLTIFFSRSDGLMRTYAFSQSGLDFSEEISLRNRLMIKKFSTRLNCKVNALITQLMDSKVVMY